MSDERISVKKFKVKEPLIIASKLFLENDVLYIQHSDPVAGRPQLVFAENKDMVGNITSDLYWSAIKKMEEVK